MIGLTSIVLVVCMGSLLVFLTKRRGKSSRGQGLPPGPPKLPIIGSIPFMGGSDIRMGMLNLAQRYGAVISVKIGCPMMILLNGYDAIEAAFCKQGKLFTGRPETHMTEKLGGKGIAGSQGLFWKTQRKHFMCDLKNSMTDLEEIALEEMNILLKIFEKRVGTVFNPCITIKRALTNMMLMFNLGTRYEYDNSIFDRYNDWMETISRSSVLMCLPFLRYCPGDPFCYKKCDRTKASWISEYSLQILEHRQTLKTEHEKNNFVTRYLKTMEADKDNVDSTFSESQLAHLIDELVVAGVETTSSALSWAIQFLVTYPAIQTKMAAEIKAVFGEDQNLQYRHLVDMPYTRAVISEILRMSDVTPVSLPHATTEDVMFGGYKIPRGTMVAANMTTANMDPNLFENPSIFSPERFLDDSGKYSKPEKFIPFSIGKRMCPGAELAKLDIFIILSSLLRNFRLSLPEGSQPLKQRGIMGLTHSPRPFDIVLEKR